MDQPQRPCPNSLSIGLPTSNSRLEIAQTKLQLLPGYSSSRRLNDLHLKEQPLVRPSHLISNEDLKIQKGVAARSPSQGHLPAPTSLKRKVYSIIKDQENYGNQKKQISISRQPPKDPNVKLTRPVDPGPLARAPRPNTDSLKSSHKESSEEDYKPVQRYTEKFNQKKQPEQSPKLQKYLAQSKLTNSFIKSQRDRAESKQPSAQDQKQTKRQGFPQADFTMGIKKPVLQTMSANHSDQLTRPQIKDISIEPISKNLVLKGPSLANQRSLTSLVTKLPSRGQSKPIQSGSVYWNSKPSENQSFFSRSRQNNFKQTLNDLQSNSLSLQVKGTDTDKSQQSFKYSVIKETSNPSKKEYQSKNPCNYLSTPLWNNQVLPTKAEPLPLKDCLIKQSKAKPVAATSQIYTRINQIRPQKNILPKTLNHQQRSPQKITKKRPQSFNPQIANAYFRPPEQVPPAAQERQTIISSRQTSATKVKKTIQPVEHNVNIRNSPTQRRFDKQNILQDRIKKPKFNQPYKPAQHQSHQYVAFHQQQKQNQPYDQQRFQRSKQVQMYQPVSPKYNYQENPALKRAHYIPQKQSQKSLQRRGPQRRRPMAQMYQDSNRQNYDKSFQSNTGVRHRPVKNKINDVYYGDAPRFRQKLVIEIQERVSDYFRGNFQRRPKDFFYRSKSNKRESSLKPIRNHIGGSPHYRENESLNKKYFAIGRQFSYSKDYRSRRAVSHSAGTRQGRRDFGWSYRFYRK